MDGNGGFRPKLAISAAAASDPLRTLGTAVSLEHASRWASGLGGAWDEPSFWYSWPFGGSRSCRKSTNGSFRPKPDISRAAAIAV